VPDPPLRLFLADVDGTLVTPDKVLTPQAAAAVARLKEAGVAFAVTSGRPPRGMAMLIEPLALETPIAGFNGGVVVDPQFAVLDQRTLPPEMVGPVTAQLRRGGLDVWLYRGADWYLTDPDGPHVDKEARTVQFAPTVVGDFDDLTEGVAKLVGVSDDHDQVAALAAAVHDAYGDRVSAARSQPYYVDVTHPEANKGAVLVWLARRLGVPLEETATIGDMPNDVLMFAHSGLSIAMGNADREVQRAARGVTAGNDAEGFAQAVERFVLPRAPGAR
jgi:Cof subfamily protein (haloacid dehalogenase superfamily)